MTDHLIHLVGPGGAGKSTAGPALAKRLGVEYVDSDHQFTIIAGSISGYIDTRGYAAYAARNLDLYDHLVRRIDCCAVFALSSGFMTYPLDIHSSYGRYRAAIATSPMTFVLLPSLELEICVAETVRRQMTRPFARTRMREEAVIRERFGVYSDLTACKVETMRPVDQVCDDLVTALADRHAHGPRRTCPPTVTRAPGRPVSPQPPLRK